MTWRAHFVNGPAANTVRTFTEGDPWQGIVLAPARAAGYWRVVDGDGYLNPEADGPNLYAYRLLTVVDADGEPLAHYELA